MVNDVMVNVTIDDVIFDAAAAVLEAARSEAG